MVASDHPGCCGAAARLPKKPGIQKLTPPSSASAYFGTETTAASVIALQTKPVLMARVRAAGRSRHGFVAATVGFISAPVMVARPMQHLWQRPRAPDRDYFTRRTPWLYANSAAAANAGLRCQKVAASKLPIAR